jgi:hypothetical protein
MDVILGFTGMRIFLIFLLFSISSTIFAQLGVGYYQSNLPFVAISYEFKNKLRPEVRFGSDNYLNNLGLEGIMSYNFIKNDDFECYIGLGGRLNVFDGVVIPVGLNFYPLPEKRFGLHIELAPIFTSNQFTENILRGSWGIRYRFIKQQ